jgi:hypothetical protein
MLPVAPGDPGTAAAARATLCRRDGRRGHGRPHPYVAIGVTAGVLGSAWWWIEWEKGDAWKYFPLHGMTWGVLVGLAAWRAARRAEHAA